MIVRTLSELCSKFLMNLLYYRRFDAQNVFNKADGVKSSTKYDAVAYYFGNEKLFESPNRKKETL